MTSWSLEEIAAVADTADVIANVSAPEAAADIVVAAAWKFDNYLIAGGMRSLRHFD